MNTRLAIAALVAAGLAVSPFAVQAKSHHKKHHMSSQSMTTGANMKKSGGASEGTVGSGASKSQTPPPATPKY
jgi:hypothetical protein